MFFDSGKPSGPPGGGPPISGGPPGGGDGGPPISGPSPPSGGAPPDWVVPLTVLYNLSIVSNIPVWVMIVAVFASSAATALSILCLWVSNLMSSSENPNICFLAQVAEVGANEFGISLTKSL